MTVDQILTNLKKKIYHPVYLLHGEEPYYIDVVSDFIENNVLDEIEKEFNQTVLYGRDVDVASVVAMAKRYPMMSNHQVVIVKEAQDLNKIEELNSYFDNPLESTILVLCHKYKKVDKRKAFTKTVEKKGILFESAKLYDDKIPDWITRYVQERSFTINLRTAQLLTETLGNDLTKIVNELSKLFINLPAQSEITPELIERNIGISKDFNIFEFQKALGELNILKCNQITNYFAANPKENPLPKLIAVLHGFFVKIMIYHQNKTLQQKDIAALLGVNPYFLKDYQKAANSFPISKAANNIGILREYDLKSKGIGSVSASEGELMKEMLFKLIH
jgi:DNA polymerase III subunit delta